MNGGRWVTLLLLVASIDTTKSGELSTEDPHLVGYVSDTITLPCEHTVTKADLEAVLWRKDTDLIVAEYDVGDDPPVAFYESMEGRGSAKVFPPTLTFSRASLEDAGVYQCEVLPLEDQAIVHRYTLTVNAKPFNEAIRLNGRSYQNCEEVYLSESTDDLLSSLSCTTSSKPSSRLSWTSDPATPALVVNQSTAAECNTAANGIVTCESNTTIVTKDLEDLVHVTCVTHYDDGQTVMTSKRACVVLVPFGYRRPWVTVVTVVMVTLVVVWLVGIVVVLIFIFIIWKAKKENTTAPVGLCHLALGLGLALLLPALGVAVFIFLTYWKLLPGKKAETKRFEEERGEQKQLREAGSNREDGTNDEGYEDDKEEETTVKTITTGPM